MIFISVDWDGPTPRKLRKELTRLKKQAFIHLGERWIRKYLKIHFTTTAMGRYDYTERGKAYKGKKRHTGRGRTPLVWSGESKTLALASARVASATSKGLRIAINSPGLNRRARGSRVNMRREVTAIRQDEISWLSEQFTTFIVKRINRLSEGRKVRFTG